MVEDEDEKPKKKKKVCPSVSPATLAPPATALVREGKNGLGGSARSRPRSARQTATRLVLALSSSPHGSVSRQLPTEVKLVRTVHSE